MNNTPEMGARERVLRDVAAELAEQVRNYGRQEHPPSIWLAVLTEEVGEVAAAILEERAALDIALPRPALVAARRHIRDEAVQAAAVAVALVEWLDRHTCRVCGCTDEAACAGGCSWAEPGLCSRCVGKDHTALDQTLDHTTEARTR